MCTFADWNKCRAIWPEKEIWLHEPTGLQAVLKCSRDTWDLQHPSTTETLVGGFLSLLDAMRYVEQHGQDTLARL